MADDPYKIDTPSAGKQFLVALFVAAIGGTGAYLLCYGMATPDQQVGGYQARGAYKFVYYVTALVAGIVFIITMKLYKLWADKKYQASLGPPVARAIERKD